MMPLDKSYLILLAVCAGFTSLYLGYRLFIKGIEGSSDLEGEIKKVKLTLRNASPGLFFALFGAFIIVAGIYKEEIHTIEWENGKFKEVTIKGQSEGVERENAVLTAEIVRTAIEYRKKGDNDQSKALYLLALTKDYKNALTHNNLASMYLEEGEYELALDHALKATAFVADDDIKKAAYYDTLARIYVKNNELAAAQTAIEKAVELDPKGKEYMDLLNQVRQALEGK